jgi:GNAT superfamily N-acetyltransferase
MSFRGVRPAQPSDAAAIAELQFVNWQTLYGPLLPASVLAGLDRDTLAAEWDSTLTTPSNGQVHVAVEGDDVVGFAAFEIFGTTAELEIFLIHPDQFGQGHGSRLMSACAEHMRSAGCSSAVTWLLSGDVPLQTFLVSTGWGTDGAVREVADDGGNRLMQVRLTTSFAIEDPAGPPLPPDN